MEIYAARPRFMRFSEILQRWKKCHLPVDIRL